MIDAGEFSPAPHLIRHSRFLLGLVPGVLLCAAITAAAELLQRAEEGATGRGYVEALVIAILIGALIRTFWQPGGTWSPGIKFTAATLLESAIVLLGATVSLTTLLGTTPRLLVGIVGVVAIALTTSYGVSRLLGLPHRLSLLIACGNSICGNSAIAAVAPVIGAGSDDIASSLAFTAILSVVVVVGLPLLIPIIHYSATQYGILAGLTVYAVPQVLAATVPVGVVSAQIGTVVKLGRVLLLGPLVLGLSLSAGWTGAAIAGSPGSKAGGRRPRLGRLVPWFIIGFLVLGAIRSLGFVPNSVLGPVNLAANILTVAAMAALGLGVDLRILGRVGGRVTAALTASLLILLGLSIGVIWLLHIA